jgi:hypothetical protein
VTDYPFSPEKLLSICVTGRDDNYIFDFKYRLATTLNYLTRNFAQLRRLNDVEIVVTDWGSDIPLAQSLLLSEEAAEICRFVHVPPSAAQEAQGGQRGFHTALATNVGARRARGEFVLSSAGDTLFPVHGAEMILKVLENKAGLPIRAENAFFLCPRYEVPWQFVERRPDLAAWDRHLLLNTIELNYNNNVGLCVASGSGGYLMHRDLWWRLRGGDERFGGWGFTDIEFGLRASQVCPWFGLSSLGVNFYHMGHGPNDQRDVALANANPHSYNWKVEANTDTWGLGDCEFEEQKARTVLATKQAAEEDHNEEGKFDGSKGTEQLARELRAGPQSERIRRGLTLFRRKLITVKELEALVFLEWRAVQSYPRCYLEFGVRRGYASAIVAAVNPAAEIYGCDEWQGVESVESEDAEITEVALKLRGHVGHCAYARFVNGPLDSAITRLRESFIGRFCPDLVLVRGELFGDRLRTQVGDLLQYLDRRGALVVTGVHPGDLRSCWDEWQKASPQTILLLSKSGGAGMILSDERLVRTGNGARVVNCDFDVSSLLEQFVVPKSNRMALRLIRALRQPSRYLEFSVLLLLWLVRRKWPHLIVPK